MNIDQKGWACLLLVLIAGLSAGCDGDGGGSTAQTTNRCDTCGMVVSPDSGWRAGGEGRSFDAPKCLFRYLHREGEVREPWVIEYYSQERRPAREMLYVIGSDLESPMGRDLVPVAGREAAERLMKDHAGERILTFYEVSPEMVDALFQPRR